MAIAVGYGLLFAILRRPCTAGAMTVYLLGFALLSSFTKQVYLGMAMTLADMRFFLLHPLENMYLFSNYPVLGGVLLAVLMGVAVIVLAGIKLEQPMTLLAGRPFGAWLRLVTASAALVLGMGASVMASKDSVARPNEGDATAAWESMYKQQHPGGLVSRLNVFFANRSFATTVPAQYAQTRFGVGRAATGAPIDAAVKPDILLVLEESTFDPTLIRACPALQCDNAMLHPLATATRTQQGPLLVHTTGGGTYLAEFAVMSGLDWRVFGRGGAFAPVSLAPRLRASLPIRLRALGYRTVALYPTDGNFLSARAAYRYYGFDEFYDGHELNLPLAWVDRRDAMMFDGALQFAQRKIDPRPLFMFVSTIRNHGPHGGSPEKLPALFAEATRHITPGLADYLSRMRDSSNEYVKASQHWLTNPRPRVLAWFGDHQPMAAWGYTLHAELLNGDRLSANVAREQVQYVTFYQFSANFGAREQNIARDALDLSYLGAELLHFAGLPLDGGAIATRAMAKACNGLMIDCRDRALINDYLSYRIYDLGAVR